MAVAVGDHVFMKTSDQQVGIAAGCGVGNGQRYLLPNRESWDKAGSRRRAVGAILPSASSMFSSNRSVFLSDGDRPVRIEVYFSLSWGC